MKLNRVGFSPATVRRDVNIIRQMQSVQSVEVGWGEQNKWPAAEFWKKLDAGEFGKPSGPAPQDAVKFEGHAYKFFPDVLTWHQAKSRCEELGGHLAVIDSVAENNFIVDLARKGIFKRENMDGVWLGATDEKQEGQWRWIDGTALEFNVWGPGQPNNKENNEHYLLLYLAEGVWSDQPTKSVQHTAYFVCEWDEPFETALRLTNRPWDTPAFQQWVTDVQALPAEKQVEVVSRKLVELNPGFDGKLGQKIENGAVAELAFNTGNFTDISPVRALTGLSRLSVGESKLSDLSPLDGMPLQVLNCAHTQVHDLSAIRGMRLTSFSCGYTKVSDLTPLQGMPLKNLGCLHTPVSDLSPLIGMHLTYLDCHDTNVSDLSPLRDVPLTSISFTPKNISKGIEVIREMKTLTGIGVIWNGERLPPDQFWRKYDAGEFGRPLNDQPAGDLLKK
jgi:hypothetical protein